MAFPSETLIIRPEIDIGSNLRLLLGDVHAAACGLLMKGLRPLHAFPGFLAIEIYSLISFISIPREGLFVKLILSRFP